MALRCLTHSKEVKYEWHHTSSLTDDMQVRLHKDDTFCTVFGGEILVVRLIMVLTVTFLLGLLLGMVSG